MLHTYMEFIVLEHPKNNNNKFRIEIRALVSCNTYVVMTYNKYLIINQFLA